MSTIYRTIDSKVFNIKLPEGPSLDFLVESKKRYLHFDWFILPDYFQNYPVNPENHDLSPLEELKVVVQSDNTTLYQGIDESYDLIVGADGASLTAETVFGALRGLETFSQLIDFGWVDDDGKTIFVIKNTPLSIRDEPAFVYRGLLIDTSRHFLPLDLILKNLNAMAMNKLNVLHWHITDSQSWPWASETYPELAEKGAYRPERVYTTEMIQKVVREAYRRGIMVIPEIDLPGHSQSIAMGHPEWMSRCPDPSEPINPTLAETYNFVTNLFREVKSLFTTADTIHLGGDEVPLACWKNDTQIQTWMRQHNLSTEVELFEYFEKRLIDTVGDGSHRLVVWQDVYDIGVNIPKETIIDVWKDWVGQDIYATINNATADGHNVVISSCWYLDQLRDKWEDYYECDLMKYFVNATNEQRQLLLGGHASMWGEHVDASNFMSRVWPRASSTAERLWHSEPKSIKHRMPRFRCHMLRRGINAGPTGPGSCEKEPMSYDAGVSYPSAETGSGESLG